MVDKINLSFELRYYSFQIKISLADLYNFMMLSSTSFDILIEDETQFFEVSSTILKRQYDQLKIVLEQKKQELEESYKNIRVLSKNSIKLTRKLMEMNQLYRQTLDKYELSGVRIAQLQQQLKSVTRQSRLKDQKMVQIQSITIQKSKMLELLNQQVARKQMIQLQLNIKCNDLYQKINQLQTMFQHRQQSNHLTTRIQQLQRKQSTAIQHILQIGSDQVEFKTKIQKTAIFDYQQEKHLEVKINKLKYPKSQDLQSNILLLRQWLTAKNAFILGTYGLV